MAATLYTVTGSPSTLAFTTRPGTRGYAWWYDLTFDGRPLYNIGNLCGTFESLFVRVGNPRLPLVPSALSHLLAAGRERVTPAIRETVGAILPDGDYVVSLLTVYPLIVTFADRTYAPRNLSAGRVTPTTPEPLDEIILPLIDDEHLHPPVIDAYKNSMRAGATPTALALSMVDSRTPSSRMHDWNLVHFLLDGHHKLAAARELDVPLRVLSFLSRTASMALPEDMQYVVRLRYDPNLILPSRQPRPTG